MIGYKSGIYGADENGNWIVVAAGYNLQGEDDFVFVGFFYPPALQSPTHQ